MTEIDRFFYSLMDQSRLRCLFLLLGEEEISAGDMTQALGLVQSKVSWHVAALRAEGLVLDHRKAQRVYEPITPIRPPQSVNLGMVELGKKLYFDPRLSNSGFISCNSCHNLSMGGTDNSRR
jgi:cytochrome c peroxidase